jgi:serine/threonine-protein kinase
LDRLTDALSDRYRIERELGAGGMATVYLAPPAIISRVMTERPRQIRATRPVVPAGVDAAILRALEKSPADRFSSCGAFAKALAAGVHQTEASGGAVQNAGSSPRPTIGRRAGHVGALVGLAIVVAAGVLLTRPARSPDPAASVSGAERSLAVLPFTSVGGDTANSYFAAGVADELTSALTQIPGLRLAGRISAARVKAEGRGAQEIGDALDVTAVLDGSVRRAGQRIRVSAELTGTADGRVLWSETYERALEDVFAVQDDITRSIASALQVRLAGGDAAGKPNARGGTTDLAAYDLYLRELEGFRARGPALVDAERELGWPSPSTPGRRRPIIVWPSC